MEKSIPHFKTREELSKHIASYYVIDDYMESYEKYTEFQEQMYDLIKGCYEYRMCRTMPIKFRFYDRNMTFHTLELREFVVNLFYWYPFVELHGVAHPLDEEYILHAKDIPNINDKINLLIQTLRDYNVKNITINYDISQVLYNLRRISGDFSLIMGLNFDMVTIMKMYRDIPEFRDIMETKIDENMQPSEIEAVLEEKQDALIKLLKDIPNNPIGIILRSGTGIKHKQLSEFLISRGLFPDLSGNTIPLPIKGSTVLGGLQTPADLYIDGNGARKSLIMSHKVMGRAGHFGKVLTELSRTISLSTTVSDCGTTFLIPYYVTCKKFLQKIDGKFFTLDKNDPYAIRPINASKDKDLIGKTIYVRSIATCALGDQVCAKCFGLHANLNFDIADGIGAFSAEEAAKVLEQNILSTKHLLTTFSEKIKFSEPFERFLSIVSDEIYPIINGSDVDDIDDWVIIIGKDSLKKSDEMDSEEGFNTYIYDGTFILRNTKTGEEYKIEEENHKEIFLTNDCLQLLRKGKGQIHFKHMDDDTALFVITIINNELTKPLYELMNLVNSDKSFVDRNIADLSQRMIELFVESNIGASAASAEIIVNRLIRKEDDIFARPDFTGSRMPKYKIVTVAKALEKNESPLVGLSYQYVKRQLLDDDTINRKDKTSYLDPFFMEKLSTKKRKEHIRYMLEKKREKLEQKGSN